MSSPPPSDSDSDQPYLGSPSQATNPLPQQADNHQEQPQKPDANQAVPVRNFGWFHRAIAKVGLASDQDRHVSPDEGQDETKYPHVDTPPPDTEATSIPQSPVSSGETSDQDSIDTDDWHFCGAGELTSDSDTGAFDSHIAALSDCDISVNSDISGYIDTYNQQLTTDDTCVYVRASSSPVGNVSSIQPTDSIDVCVLPYEPSPPVRTGQPIVPKVHSIDTPQQDTRVHPQPTEIIHPGMSGSTRHQNLNATAAHNIAPANTPQPITPQTANTPQPIAPQTLQSTNSYANETLLTTKLGKVRTILSVEPAVPQSFKQGPAIAPVVQKPPTPLATARDGLASGASKTNGTSSGTSGSDSQNRGESKVQEETVISGESKVQEETVISGESKAQEEMRSVNLSDLPPLLRDQLLNPHTNRDWKQQGALVEQGLMAGSVAVSRVRGKNVVFLLGNTRVGKTVLWHSLRGDKLKEAALEDIDPDTYKFDRRRVIVLANSSNSEERSMIGHRGDRSETFLPNSHTFKDGTILEDAPGYGDTAGEEISIANSINIQRMMRCARSVRIIMVIGPNFQDDGYASLNKTLSRLVTLYGGTDNCVRQKHSFLLGFTRQKELTLKGLRHIFETYDLHECAKHIADRTFITHPLNKMPGNDPSYEWIPRDKLLDTIFNMSPVASGTKFTIQLSSDETLSMTAMFKEMGRDFKDSLQNRQYEEVKSAVMQAFSMVEAPEIRELFDTVIAIAREHGTELWKQALAASKSKDKETPQHLKHYEAYEAAMADLDGIRFCSECDPNHEAKELPTSKRLRQICEKERVEDSLRDFETKLYNGQHPKFKAHMQERVYNVALRKKCCMGCTPMEEWVKILMTVKDKLPFQLRALTRDEIQKFSPLDAAFIAPKNGLWEVAIYENEPMCIFTAIANFKKSPSNESIRKRLSTSLQKMEKLCIQAHISQKCSQTLESATAAGQLVDDFCSNLLQGHNGVQVLPVLYRVATAKCRVLPFLHDLSQLEINKETDKSLRELQTEWKLKGKHAKAIKAAKKRFCACIDDEAIYNTLIKAADTEKRAQQKFMNCYHQMMRSEVEAQLAAILDGLNQDDLSKVRTHGEILLNQVLVHCDDKLYTRTTERLHNLISSPLRKFAKQAKAHIKYRDVDGYNAVIDAMQNYVRMLSGISSTLKAEHSEIRVELVSLYLSCMIDDCNGFVVEHRDEVDEKEAETVVNAVQKHCLKALMHDSDCKDFDNVIRVMVDHCQDIFGPFTLKKGDSALKRKGDFQAAILTTPYIKQLHTESKAKDNKAMQSMLKELRVALRTLIRGLVDHLNQRINPKKMDDIHKLFQQVGKGIRAGNLTSKHLIIVDEIVSKFQLNLQESYEGAFGEQLRRPASPERKRAHVHGIVRKLSKLDRKEQSPGIRKIGEIFRELKHKLKMGWGSFFSSKGFQVSGRTGRKLVDFRKELREALMAKLITETKEALKKDDYPTVIANTRMIATRFSYPMGQKYFDSIGMSAHENELQDNVRRAIKSKNAESAYPTFERYRKFHVGMRGHLYKFNVVWKNARKCEDIVIKAIEKLQTPAKEQIGNAFNVDHITITTNEILASKQQLTKRFPFSNAEAFFKMSARFHEIEKVAKMHNDLKKAVNDNIDGLFNYLQTYEKKDSDSKLSPATVAISLCIVRGAAECTGDIDYLKNVQKRIVESTGKMKNIITRLPTALRTISGAGLDRQARLVDAENPAFKCFRTQEFRKAAARNFDDALEELKQQKMHTEGKAGETSNGKAGETSKGKAGEISKGNAGDKMSLKEQQEKKGTLLSEVFSSVDIGYMKTAMDAYAETFGPFFNKLMNVHNIQEKKSREAALDELRKSAMKVVYEVRDEAKSFEDLRNDPKQAGKLLGCVSFGLTFVDSISGGFESDNQVKQLLPAQVSAVLMTLSVGESAMVQLETGGGKSLVTAGLAIILALYGFCVPIASYRSDLAARDKLEMLLWMKFFGVENMITYVTFQDLLEQQLASNGNTRQGTLLFLKEDYKALDTTSENAQASKKMSALIVDECDTLVWPELTNCNYKGCVVLKPQSMQTLLQKLWDNREEFLQMDKKQAIKKIEKDDLAKQFLKIYPNMDKLMPQQYEDMLTALARIDAREKNPPPQPEYDVKDGHIGYLNETTGEYNYNVVRGYQTAFSYIREYQKSTIKEEDMRANLGVSVSTGIQSYSSLLDAYSIKLGVSGTIHCLSEYELTVLKDYGFKRFLKAPKVFSKKPPQGIGHFNVHGGTCDSTTGQFHNIKVSAMRQVKQDRAVLVVCRDTKQLQAYHRYIERHPYSSDVNASFATLSHRTPFIPVAVVGTQGIETPAGLRELDKRQLIISQVATVGRITTTVRTYGRGSDFACRSQALRSNGGLHVIQAFLSEFESEEIQIRYRTCRQNDPGSVEHILHLGDLEVFGIKTQSQIKDWDTLHKARNRYARRRLARSKRMKTRHKEFDDKTARYMELLTSGEYSSKKDEVIELLLGFQK